MSTTLRPYEAGDATALLPLLNVSRSAPMSLDVFERQEAAWPSEQYKKRVLLFEGDEVVGQGTLYWWPFVGELDLQADLSVHPAARRRGHGARLLSELEEMARRRGATRLLAGVRDDDPQSRAWAERRGYTLDVHRFASELDLDTFDESRFAPDLKRHEREGVVFEFMQSADEGTWNELADFYAELLTMAPDMRGLPRWTREQVLWQLRDRPGASDGELVVARRGEQWLGLTALAVFPKFAYNEMTGVAPAARGRGLALALKLSAIRVAREKGKRVMRTNNLDVNAPMLAVNHKLGFVRLGGLWMMQRLL